VLLHDPNGAFGTLEDSGDLKIPFKIPMLGIMVVKISENIEFPLAL